MDLVKVSRIICFFIILLISFNASAQDKPLSLKTAKIDSVLSKYRIEGIKVFVKKLGVLSVKDKKLALSRSELNNKLLIKMQKKLSLKEEGISAQFDYKLNTYWFLRGESYHRNWGQQSGVSLIYEINF